MHRVLSVVILLAGVTGFSTSQARTAVPAAVNVAGVSGNEGSSLSFARADHIHSLTGVVGFSNGGTGNGNLASSCTGDGQAVVLGSPGQLVCGLVAQNAFTDLTTSWGLTDITDGDNHTMTTNSMTWTDNGASGITFATTAVKAHIGATTYSLAPLKAGTVALTSGTPSTKTVALPISGMTCTCTEATTAANNGNLKCAVAATTLTITGPNTVSDSINYTCMVSQ